MSKARKKWVASIGAIAAFATLATGGALTANAADTSYTPASPNADVAYPSFKGSDDPMKTKENSVAYNPTQSYLAKTFEQDQKNGAGNDTDHDFWIDSILARTGTAPTGSSSNDAGKYNYDGADHNQFLFTRGRALYMYSHSPNQLGFVGDTAYWDQTGKNGFTVTVNADGADQRLNEDGAQRKQTPSYFKSVFQTGGKSLKVTEVKYITHNNVMVANLTVESTKDRDVTIRTASPFATDGADGATELTGTTAVKNNLTTIYPRLSANLPGGDNFKAANGELTGTISLKANEPQTIKIQLGMIANELPDSTKEYEARYNGDLKDPAASYKDSVTTYNKWWVDNSPYVDTPEDNIDKTVVYRWWLSRFNMLDANMPGNTFQYPTSIEGVLGYNNQIVLTSGMFINDTKWFRNPEYSYGTWLSAGDTAKKGKSGYYYYHDNPGDPANWNHSYTQYITKAGWDSYKVHGGPSTVAAKLADQGAEDVQGLLNSQTEPDNNDNQNNNKNSLIDWSWWSMTGNDADAVSFSEPGRSGQRMDRADGSANLWANANAAAKAYKAAGDTANAEKLQKIADDIQSDVLNNLWNKDTKLVQHKWLKDGAFAKYKEINNYYPYSEGLMPTDGTYDDALRLFADADEFPIFPFFTANQADKKALNYPGSNNFAIINATPLLQVYSAGIRDYNANTNGYITNESFKKLLYWVAFAHYQGGDNNYPDQNEFWNEDNNSVKDLNGDGKVDNADKNLDARQNGGKITYRSWIHHTQLGTTNWTMVEDVAGMVPREDNKIELNPIAIPGWDYFTVNNLSYHGQNVSIVWDKDGSHYGGPAGYSLYVGGKLAFTSDKLAHIVYDPATGKAEVQDQSGAKVSVAGDAVKDVKSANQVTYSSDQRVTELLATAGVNVDKDAKNQTNVAKDGKATATYETDGYPAGNAVDGKTVMESFWGTKGSKNKTDTLTVEFKDGAQDIDDIRLYFYQSSSSQTIAGYSEPSNYKLEYQAADGSWHPIEDQVRTPAYSGANYNRIQFTKVNAKAIRATFTPQSGKGVGIKEIEAYHTDIKAEGSSKNQAPQVSASVESNTASGATIVSTVKDDGLPAEGAIATKWEQLSGPEGGKATFADASAASTTVTFNVEGDYELKLTATDGELDASTTVKLHGVPSDGTVNIASQGKIKVNSINSYLPSGNEKVLNDGKYDFEGAAPNSSWNNWGANKNGTVTVTFAGEVPISKVQPTFWSDGGGVPMPKGWKVQYQAEDGSWKDVTLKDGQKYTITKGKTDSVSFEQVWTKAVRVVFTSNPTGMSELEVYAAEPLSVDGVNKLVQTGTKAADLNLPATVSAVYKDGSRHDLTVTWDKVTDDQLASDNEFDVAGTVIGYLKGANAHVASRSDANAQTAGAAQPVEQTVVKGSKSVTLPATVPVRFPNGMLDDRKVTWNADELAKVDLNTVGDYVVTGTAEASSAAAKMTVHVVAASDAGSEPEAETTIASIEVKAPTKTEYTVGDALDTKGLEVTATLSDKTTKKLAADEYQLFGFDSRTVGEQTITVTPKANPFVHATFTVTVKEPEPSVDSVVISGDGVADGKLSLTEGGSAALVAEVKVTGGAAKTVSWSSSDDAVATVSDKGEVKAVKAGKATITATSTVDASKKASVEVTVTAKEQPEPTVASIAVTGKPAKTEYLVGEQLDTKGLEVTATLSDGKTRVLDASEYVLAGFDSSKPGVVTVTVSLKADPKVAAAFEVTVKAKEPQPEPEPGDKAAFADVDDKTPHKADIDWLAERKVSEGWDNGDGTRSFGPMRTVVRQDMAAFLYRLAGSPSFDESKVVNPFADVDESTPHYKEILWLYSTGISRGYAAADGSLTFGGMRTVVRQDMAAFLHRLAEYKGADVAPGDSGAFPDVTKDTPHAGDIAWLAGVGVTDGFEDGSFGGMRDVVRQDMAAFLHRMDANVLSKR